MLGSFSFDIRDANIVLACKKSSVVTLSVMNITLDVMFPTYLLLKRTKDRVIFMVSRSVPLFLGCS